MDDSKNLGIRVTEARLVLKINRSELSRRAGLTPAAVWQIEEGLRQPNSDTLKKLSESLRVSSDWLLSGKEVPGWLQEAQELDPEMVAMFRGLPTLSESDRAAIKNVWDAMKKREDGK